MKPMIQGTEHEYTLYCREMDRLGLDPHVIALDILRESSLHGAGEFTRNQSRAYLDCGHLELSTCETSNFCDLLVWEKAGEKIVDWLRKKAEELHCSPEIKIWAYKNNTSPDGTAYGSHENYCVSRDVIFPERYVRELVPHLVTRLVYTGAGDILDGKYVLSPSAYKTGTLVSNDTMHNTGVLNTRDEPHAGAERYRRLHLQIGDALLNECAIVLRHFTTSAVLQLMESGALKNPQPPKLADPVRDMWNNVEITNPEKWKFELDNGKTATPMDIQQYYLEKTEHLVETGIEKKAFRMWDEILELLRKKDGKKLARRVEWLDRYYAIQEMSDGYIDSEMSMKVCKRYSELGEERSIHYMRRRNGLIDRFTEDNVIADAITHPPSNTRAHARAEICEKHEILGIEWSRIVVKTRGDTKTIQLEDPYKSSVPK